jgi:hypothetical protein
LAGRELPIAQVVSNVDAELAGICQRAMHVDPEQRYPSADAMRKALQQYLVKHRAPMEPAAIGKLMQKRFRAECNMRHRHINAQLHGERPIEERPPRTDSAAESMAAVSGPHAVSSFIRRRSLLRRVGDSLRADRTQRFLLRLLAVWLIALTALALLPDLVKLGLLLE